MAKYLRPRRGSKDSAFAQKILLKKGEMFLEFPNSEIGRGPGRLVVGDGATSYQNMNYTSTATNVFRPFITDPELYVPRFENSTYATSGWTVDAGTEAINAMGDGSSASTVALPTFLGLVKNALCKHTNSIVKINNDLADKADKTIFSVSAEGLVPKPTNATTANFLRGDGTWVAAAGNSLASTTSDGLVRKLNPTGQETRFLRGDNTWATPPDTKYNLASTESAGLLRVLPNDSSTYNYFLRANGTWYNPQSVLAKSHDYASTTSESANTYFTERGAFQLNQNLNNTLISTQFIEIHFNYTSEAFVTDTVSLIGKKDGYMPIGVVGFNTGTDRLYPNTAAIEYDDNDMHKGKLYVAAHNVTTMSGASTGGCTILWLRDPIN
jgi:hypothetical protein